MRNRNAVSQFERVMLFQQQKKTGHAELSPLISLNCRSIRRDVFLS
jgi:hypothetical protein